MATVGNPKRAHKFKSYLIEFGLFGLFELIALFVALGAGEQSYEGSLNWFTSINVTVGVLVFVGVLMYKHSKHTGKTPQAAKMQPKWRSPALTVMWLVLLVGTFLGWHSVVFPWTINTALHYSGADATAIITKTTFYQFQGAGRGGHYVQVSGLAEADSMQLRVAYAGHTSTIFLHESDADFGPVNSRLQIGNRRLPVRYLWPLPGLVRIATISF